MLRRTSRNNCIDSSIGGWIGIASFKGLKRTVEKKNLAKKTMDINPRKIREVEERSDMVIDSPKPSQIVKHVKLGDRISYIGTDGKYRSGGFVMKIGDDGDSISLSGGNLKWTLYTEKIETIYLVKKE
jgi:hypothetical protein